MLTHFIITHYSQFIHALFNAHGKQLIIVLYYVASYQFYQRTKKLIVGLSFSKTELIHVSFTPEFKGFVGYFVFLAKYWLYNYSVA